MVVAIRFVDLDEFNLFCRLQRLGKEEIIDISHERGGGIVLVIDRKGTEVAEWEKRKSRFLKELQGQ